MEGALQAVGERSAKGLGYGTASRAMSLYKGETVCEDVTRVTHRLAQHSQRPDQGEEAPPRSRRCVNTQPPLPVDDNFEQWLKNTHLEPSQSLAPLSQLFPHVERDHLHIVVQAPTKDVIHAFDPRNFSRSIALFLAIRCKIPKTDNVSILKKMIKEEKKRHLDQVDASDLNIWKVSFPIDDLDSQEPPTIGPSLKPHMPLSTIFSLALDANHIHIAVRVTGAGASLTGSSFPPSSYKYFSSS
ncbi:hypothetical protein APHAL10511_001463 [Amanita phalloides]|nr:hypothetical protein APHAL10511_001463 [Amanita phalloides]